MTTASLIIFSIHYPQLSSHWTSVSVCNLWNCSGVVKLQTTFVTGARPLPPTCLTINLSFNYTHFVHKAYVVCVHAMQTCTRSFRRSWAMNFKPCHVYYRGGGAPTVPFQGQHNQSGRYGKEEKLLPLPRSPISALNENSSGWRC